MLRAQFTPVDDKYAIYIDVTTSADVINDILKFTQAHGWIDQMTRCEDLSNIMRNVGL